MKTYLETQEPHLYLSQKSYNIITNIYNNFIYMSKNKKNEKNCCDVCFIGVSWIYGVFLGCLMNIFENDNDNYDEDINYGFRQGIYYSRL